VAAGGVAVQPRPQGDACSRPGWVVAVVPRRPRGTFSWHRGADSASWAPGLRSGSAGGRGHESPGKMKGCGPSWPLVARHGPNVVEMPPARIELAHAGGPDPRCAGVAGVPERPGRRRVDGAVLAQAYLDEPVGALTALHRGVHAPSMPRRAATRRSQRSSAARVGPRFSRRGNQLLPRCSSEDGAPRLDGSRGTSRASC
jgi:hypothetical protein